MFGGKKKKRSVTVAEALPILEAEELEKLVDPDKAAQGSQAQSPGIGHRLHRRTRQDSQQGRPRILRNRRLQGRRPTAIFFPSLKDQRSTPSGAPLIRPISSSSPRAPLPSRNPRTSSPNSREDSRSGSSSTPSPTGISNASSSSRKNALVVQYAQLLSTENVTIEFEESSISRIAQIAAAANTQTENIGARRLHTVLERLLEELSFEADTMAGQKIVIDAAYVDARFKDYAERQDLSKYIL